MRFHIVIAAIFFALVATTTAYSHQVEGEPEATHTDEGAPDQTQPGGGESFSEGDSFSEKDGAAKPGPMERAGKNLDKALGRTITVLNNSALELKVKNHLYSHSVPWRRIRVIADNGDVTLEGEVESQEVADKVVSITKATGGVKSVLSKLTLKSDKEPVTL